MKRKKKQTRKTRKKKKKKKLRQMLKRYPRTMNNKTQILPPPLPQQLPLLPPVG